ncbi:MAG: hypothetical protein ACM3IH_19485 [Sphingobacteriales bacterium]
MIATTTNIAGTAIAATMTTIAGTVDAALSPSAATTDLFVALDAATK